MHILKRALPLALILLSASALLSLNCGIILFPVEAPKIVATNAQSIRFQADIVDQTGAPLNDVEAVIVCHALKPDALYGQADQRKPDSARMVNGSLAYKTSGNYGVFVEYRKANYQTVGYFYSNDGKGIRLNYEWSEYSPDVWQHAINVTTEPVSRVVMLPAESTTQRTNGRRVRAQ